MKMMKAMKKLKFWSRKKRAYKLLPKASSPPPPSRPPPPPPMYYPAHSQYEPLLPSAPPLPPWLEYEMQFQEMASKSKIYLYDPESKLDFPQPDICAPELDAAGAHHEQFVCDVSNSSQVAQLNRFERDVGAFGCAVSFGTHLIRCVFPCFHIREEAKTK